MELVNAIGKVRFSSSRPQRVHLAQGKSWALEMLCLEAGQEIKLPLGERAYYVVTGSATVTTDAGSRAVPAGQLAASLPGEAMVLSNTGEQRLICLAVGSASS